MAPDPRESTTEVGAAIVEIADRASALVREEIELAKAEVTEKVTKLVKGAIVAGAAGIFVVVALLFLLDAAAWGVYDIVGTLGVWFGFLVVAIVLLLLGALAGFLAAKAFKAGSPPVPAMAIDEAKKIRETVTAPASSVPAAPAVPYGAPSVSPPAASVPPAQPTPPAPPYGGPPPTGGPS